MKITSPRSVCASGSEHCVSDHRRRSRLCLAIFAVGLWTLSFRADAVDFHVTVRDQAGRPVEGAIVWAQQPGGSNPPVQSQILQKGRQFLPAVTVIPVGSSIRFPNQDSVQHHVYSFSQAKKFDIPLYIGESPPIQFDRPGIVTLGCNIHDWMAAYIVVIDTRAYAQTDAKGVALLENLPAEPATIHAWNPRLRGDPVVYHTQPGQNSAELTLKLRPAFSRTPPDDRGGYR
jgi:plastocyanin